MSTSIAGVDGCFTGWVVATLDGARVVPSFATIANEFALIGVDMPIGLPDAWGRDTDRATRSYIRPRGACVFPTPPRALLEHNDYGDANDASRARFGTGLTRQTFHLLPKIREVDAAVAPGTQHRFIEVHPECSFRALTGSVLAPKRTALGRDQRREALEPTFGAVETRLAGARADDILDAYAVLWTALRHQRGESVVFGGSEVDGRGLIMRIVA